MASVGWPFPSIQEGSTADLGRVSVGKGMLMKYLVGVSVDKRQPSSPLTFSNVL